MNAQFQKDCPCHPIGNNAQANRQLVETFLTQAHGQQAIALEAFLHAEPSCWGFPEFNPRTLGEYQGYFAFLADVFADAQFSIDRLIAENSQVLVHFSLEGIHREEFMGLAATRGKLKFSATQLFRLQQGVIHEVWMYNKAVTLTTKGMTYELKQGVNL